jgi:PhoPQ-activated pathogenicity-related protein
MKKEQNNGKPVPGTIQRSITMKKQILLTALTLVILASAVMTAAAEEVVGTILFEESTRKQ